MDMQLTHGYMRSTRREDPSVQISQFAALDWLIRRVARIEDKLNRLLEKVRRLRETALTKEDTCPLW